MRYALLVQSKRIACPLDISALIVDRFYALETLNYEKEIDPKSVLASGSQWADIAQRQIFGNMNNISVENLMVSSSLHDTPLSYSQ